MKKNWVILFLCIFFIEVKSQYSIAGQHGSVYVDIVPDTLLNSLSSHYGGVDNENYYIDINQDGINDIEIGSVYSISPGHTDREVQILALDTSTQFSFLKLDSVYRSSCGGWSNIGNILHPYVTGDTIKNNKYVSTGYLDINNTFCFVTYADSTWLKNYDQFIGVRHSGSSSISYGWIRVNVTNYQTVLIKDFSLSNSINNIEKTNIQNSIRIFPNPTTDKVYIEAKEIIYIKLFNLSGKEVLSTKEKNIVISNLQEGIYFMQVKTKEGIATKKIIIQR